MTTQAQPKTQAIVGKTIAGVICRPAKSGQPQVIMLRFDDGTVFEFLSPLAEKSTARKIKEVVSPQLALIA